MSKSKDAPEPMPTPEEDPDILIRTDPSFEDLGEITFMEAEELGLACETWEEQKWFDQQLAEERARSAAA